MISGTVMAVNGTTHKSFQLDDGKWYSTFHPNTVATGDAVSFNFAINGRWNNVKGEIAGASTAAVAVAPAAGAAPTPDAKGKNNSSWGANRTFPVGKLAPERTINRQNALIQAIVAMGQTHTDAVLHKMDHKEYAEKTIELARSLEAYTTGDLEREAVDALAKSAAIDGAVSS